MMMMMMILPLVTYYHSLHTTTGIMMMMMMMMINTVLITHSSHSITPSYIPCKASANASACMATADACARAGLHEIQ
jgi:hypothetical protein